MTRFTDNLWNDLAREHGAHLAPPGSARPRARRPGVIAGSTLVLAVGGMALTLGLTSTGAPTAGSAPAGVGPTRITTAAYTITKNSAGSVEVQFSQKQSIAAANAKLTAMGIHEQFYVFMGTGPATVAGPVTCTQAPDAQKVSGPPVEVLLDNNGTEVIAPGTTGDNTGVGTWHVARCYVMPTGGPGTGAGNTGAGG